MEKAVGARSLVDKRSPRLMELHLVTRFAESSLFQMPLSRMKWQVSAWNHGTEQITSHVAREASDQSIADPSVLIKPDLIALLNST
jgi:hypothetical protein